MLMNFSVQFMWGGGGGGAVLISLSVWDSHFIPPFDSEEKN